MKENEVHDEYGHASLTPESDVVAGSYRTWEITYTVGELGMDDGSRVKIASNMTSDWGTPQFDEPASDHYATVRTSGNATVEASYDRNGHVRPWKHTVTINVFDGSLEADDTITLTLGDTSRGSMGHRAQTFPEEEFSIIVLVDCFGTGEFVRLPNELTFDVVAGTARTLEAVVPSTLSPDEEASLSVRAEDFWGNVASECSKSLKLSADDPVNVPDRLQLSNGVGTATITVTDPGVYRLTLHAPGSDLSTTTNPVSVKEGDGKRTFWGDIHGQSGETVGTGTVDDYLEFARHRAFLDFSSHAGNDFQISDELWETIRTAIERTHEPGEFVTFLCYEWSANTVNGGDHNVYFRDGAERPIHRSSSWQINEGYDKHEGIHQVEALYEHYAGRDDVLIIPHQGGRPATLDALDPDLSPFLEIVSVWGVFEWFGQDALEKGYHVGFVGGSDDHTGRPGTSHPTNQADFNIKGGLMAVQADELTRESLWEAFNSRRCYATTGARTYLDVTVDAQPMGSCVTVDEPPEIEVEVLGTDGIEQIDLFRGTDRIASKRPTEEGRSSSIDRIEFMWSGAGAKTRHKVERWDGGLGLDHGEIVDVEPFGFDHPEDGVMNMTDTSIRWRAATSGNYQGIRIEIDGPSDAVLSFNTPPVSASFRVDELDQPRVVHGDGIDLGLTVQRANGCVPSNVDVTFTDEDVTSNTHLYYVRVRQSDGEMAWSSPIAVTVE